MSEVMSENDTSFAIEVPSLLSSSLSRKYGFWTFVVSSSWSSFIGSDLLHCLLHCISNSESELVISFSSFAIFETTLRLFLVTVEDWMMGF